jgi:hypothetical protein
MILRLVEFHRVEEFLKVGWQVWPPSRPHPVIDTRSVLLVRRCECPEDQPAEASA